MRIDMPVGVWMTSIFCTSQGDCVEIQRFHKYKLLVRSTCRPGDPTVVYSDTQWKRVLVGMRNPGVPTDHLAWFEDGSCALRGPVQDGTDTGLIFFTASEVEAFINGADAVDGHGLVVTP